MMSLNWVHNTLQKYQDVKLLVQQELTKKLNGSKRSWVLILLTITKKLLLERSWKMMFRKALIVFSTMLVDQVQLKFWLIWTWKAELLLLEQCQGIYVDNDKSLIGGHISRKNTSGCNFIIHNLVHTSFAMRNYLWFCFIQSFDLANIRTQLIFIPSLALLTPPTPPSLPSPDPLC